MQGAAERSPFERPGAAETPRRLTNCDFIKNYLKAWIQKYAILLEEPNELLTRKLVEQFEDLYTNLMRPQFHSALKKIEQNAEFTVDNLISEVEGILIPRRFRMGQPRPTNDGHLPDDLTTIHELVEMYVSSLRECATGGNRKKGKRTQKNLRKLFLNFNQENQPNSLFKNDWQEKLLRLGACHCI